MSRLRATPFALGYVAVSSAATIIAHAANGWVNPRHPELPLGVNLGVNLLISLIVGLAIDVARPHLTTRGRAAGLGGLLGVLVFPLGYLLVFSDDTEPLALVLVPVMFGIAGVWLGAVMWEPGDAE